MKKPKTALILAIVIVVVSVILYFIPLKEILGKLPLINRFYNNTSIYIVAENGKAKVKVNGKDYGETPSTVENLPEGKYTIELEKDTDATTFYQKQIFELELAKNTTARIDLEFGPESTLSGTILYYTSATTTSTGDGLLTVTSSAPDGKVYIDGKYKADAPLSNFELKDGQYQIKVTAQGYENVEIPIIVRSGYQLNLKTYHFPVPVNFEPTTN